MAVLTEVAVFKGANFFVKRAEGGPSTGSGLNISGWVEQRRHFCKQLIKCLSIRKVTYQMFKLTDI